MRRRAVVVVVVVVVLMVMRVRRAVMAVRIRVRRGIMVNMRIEAMKIGAVEGGVAIIALVCVNRPAAVRAGAWMP